MTEWFDVAVVGGGLGGLAAATLLARRGLAVTLLDRAHTLGGRAMTHLARRAEDGAPFHFNLGAHALYRGGPADRVLCALGVAWTGKAPPSHGLAIHGGRRFVLPMGPASLLSTGLLGWGAKIEQARVLARLRGVDVAALASVPLAEWIERQVRDPTLRATIEAFVRLTTFANAPERMSAGAAMQQLRRAQTSGVAFLDGGWQTLVDGATAAARAAGVRIETAAHVTDAEARDGSWAVRRIDGASIAARAIVVAAGPGVAAAIVRSPALHVRAEQAIPLRVACLDVGLRSLPDPRTTFALGVDRPLYFSVHSTSARLAPPGAALVTTMKYLSPGEVHDPVRDEAELEAWLDGLQPGWRDATAHRRSLPAMVVSHALPAAVGGGLAGRFSVAVPDAPGAFVAGDWVGPEGLLLDAVMASAEQAAEAAGAFLHGSARPSRPIARGVPAARVA
jgi:phytoene dehydrogenase-like protein